jgi:hypothetical protein
MEFSGWISPKSQKLNPKRLLCGTYIKKFAESPRKSFNPLLRIAQSKSSLYFISI